MIKSKEDLLNSISGILGESVDDAALGILEDISDTVDDYERRLKESGDWESRYNENDQAWRERYKERFFNAADSETESIDIEAEGVYIDTDDEPATFEDLFEEA